MSAPKRTQRKRTKGWRAPPGAVYVGRGSKWGNQWVIVPVTDHHFPWGEAARVQHLAEDRVLGVFERYTRHPRTGAPYWAVRAFQRDMTPEFEAEVRRELAGKDLLCWCGEDQPCHADLLLSIANDATVSAATS